MGCNALGSKGAGHRRWVGSTGNGRSLTFNGRRQPSRGDTSRMMREYQVRICERLGVKVPGPTRQRRRSQYVRNESAYPPIAAGEQTSRLVGSVPPSDLSRCSNGRKRKLDLFEHLICAGAQGGRNCQANRLGGGEIDN